MDLFGAIVVIGLVAVVVGLLLLGRMGPRTSEITDRKERERWGVQARIEERDLGQMVEGQNEYRRRHGERETTVEEVRRRVGDEQLEKLDDANREV